MVRRYLLLLKHAWTITWNLALLAALVGLPLLAVVQAGWLGVWMVLLGVAVVCLLRSPMALLALWLGALHR